MQTIINIFTIIGSILGILAFLISMFSSFHEHNIKKWEKLSSMIDFNDFINFSDGVSIGLIYTDTSNKFRKLTRLIQNESEELQFKGLARKKIKRLFIEILLETDKFYSIVQSPDWDVLKDGREDIERKINKEYFARRFKTSEEFDKNYKKSIEEASISIERIIELYREIYSLTNRLPYEFLFKKI